MKVRFALGVIATSLGLAALLFAASLLPTGARFLGIVENIHGIPYPQVAGSTAVLEHLAHSDVFIDQPVVGKGLRATVSFTPVAVKKLYIGVRENDFWLSYPWQLVYEKKGSESSYPITKTVVIPLTDKLQEADQSLDLMFLADPDTLALEPERPLEEKVHWNLHELQVETINLKPTPGQLRDYIRSIIKRERPL